jgi:predicted phosphoadenosine phosphosulfate sulfurtransferase
MLRDGDRLLVCLSGGKDSLSLLHTIRQYQFYCKAKVSDGLYCVLYVSITVLYSTCVSQTLTVVRFGDFCCAVLYNTCVLLTMNIVMTGTVVW